MLGAVCFTYVSNLKANLVLTLVNFDKITVIEKGNENLNDAATISQRSIHPMTSGSKSRGWFHRYDLSTDT
jgi:hypothetical protein